MIASIASALKAPSSCLAKTTTTFKSWVYPRASTQQCSLLTSVYLFWYEYTFVLRLHTLFSKSKSTDLFSYHLLPAGSPLLDPAASPLLRAGATTTRQVIAVILSSFTFTKRFVDDLLLAVCNPICPT